MPHVQSVARIRCFDSLPRARFMNDNIATGASTQRQVITCCGIAAALCQRRRNLSVLLGDFRPPPLRNRRPWIVAKKLARVRLYVRGAYSYTKVGADPRGTGEALVGKLVKLPRDIMLSAVYAVVMCLCVSVTLRYCIKTAKHRITQIMPHVSPGTLVFCSEVLGEIQTGSSWVG